MNKSEIIKKIDKTGKIHIPAQIRESLKIHEGEKLEIHLDKNSIVIKKIEKECIFCGKIGALREFKGKQICKCCEKEILQTRR